MAISSRMRGIEAELTTGWMGHPTTLLESVDSTNRWLKTAWTAGLRNAGAAVWADEQTAGRGRLGRQWDSPGSHNIYTSALWRPDPERLTGILSLAAGVALVQAVRAETGLEARIKWPNDAVVGGKKFAGVLLEGGYDPVPWVIVGLGINVAGEANLAFPHATTLEAARGTRVSRESLWVRLMLELETIFEVWRDGGAERVIQAWSSVNATLGQTVRVERPGHEPWIGVAEALDADGGLWVSARGRLEKVISGEVSLRLADGRYAPESF